MFETAAKIRNRFFRYLSFPAFLLFFDFFSFDSFMYFFYFFYASIMFFIFVKFAFNKIYSYYLDNLIISARQMYHKTNNFEKKCYLNIEFFKKMM